MDGAKGKIPAANPDLLLNSPKSNWNTAQLGYRLGVDAYSAVSAATLVAPIVCVIDRAIVENASTGKSTTFRDCFFRSLKPLITAPHRFLVSKPFALIFSLYFSTYATANVFDTLSSTVNAKPASTVSAGLPKFAATSAVNMSLCVYKDSYFAKWFNGASTATSVASKIPKASFALFALRDSMTIFASFNLPPLLAPKFAELPNQIGKYFDTEKKRSNAAQFFTPAAMQVFSTPVHLLGLDLYNRQAKLGFVERFARVRRDWAISAFARMGRIIPAFGVGGVVNGNVRASLMPA